MPKYRFTGKFKSGQSYEKTFEAPHDKAAAEYVEGYRHDAIPMADVKLVRIRVEEIDIPVKDVPGYEFLDWNHDCECGCQCSHVRIGSTQYAAYSRTVEGFHLDIGHGWLGGNLGKFASFADLDRHVRKLARPHFERELVANQKMAKQLGVGCDVG